MTDECTFCEIVSKRYELQWADAWWGLFPAAQPQTALHLLLVPLRHIRSIDELMHEEIAALVPAISRAVLMSGLGGQYKLEVNGPARQQIRHLHVHIFGPKRRSLVGII